MELVIKCGAKEIADLLVVIKDRQKSDFDAAIAAIAESVCDDVIKAINEGLSAQLASSHIPE